VNVTLPAFARHALDRWVLLHGAEAAAEALPGGRRAAVLSLHEAARTRIDGALGEHGVSALLLVRAAIPIYLEAVVVARSSEAPAAGSSVGDLWARYDDLVGAGLVPAVPESLSGAREHSVAGGPLDAEIAEHGEARIDEAIALAEFLADRVEVRTPRAVRVQRRLRKAALAVVVVALVAEIFVHRPKAASLALHANVVSSSRRVGSGPPLDLTNGKVEPTFAFATKDEPDPWIMIDITPSARISEVMLWNSDDHLDDSLPLQVETSSDGAAWEPAGLVAVHFTPLEPALLKFTTRSARFVRIHRKTGGAIYLTEVEVR